MPEIPEPETEAKPILRPSMPTKVDMTPVPVPPFKGGARVSLAEKIILPARTSLIWDGFRHFLFGMVGVGGGALAAFATAGVLATPYAWPIIGGLAVAGGFAEAGRKVAKEKSGGKDWTDLLYKILEFIVRLIQSKGVKK